MRRNTEWANFIPDGIVNQVISSWQNKQPDRVQTVASPSTLLDCPRVIWLKYKKKVPLTNVMGWGKKQRLLLGRELENMIAKQFKDEGILLHHWADNYAGQSVKFGMGKGLDRLEGTPDLLLKYGDHIAISDAKTSRSDSFAYVPIDPDELWQDHFWYKYKLQVTAYYMLCHQNKEWFLPLHSVGPGEDDLAGDPKKFEPLPLPDICHLFSYALDNGIVMRDISWKPTKEDATEIMRLTRRWNEAYASETMPDCTCLEHEAKGVLFCPYGITEPGKKVCSSCCDPLLINHVKELV